MALAASAAFAALLFGASSQAAGLWRLWLSGLWQRPWRDPRAATAVSRDQLAVEPAVLFAVAFRTGARRSRGRRAARLAQPAPPSRQLRAL